MTIGAQVFGAGITLLGMWMLFERFGTLKGWSFGEVALCYACVHFCYAVTKLIGQGFELFSETVKAGDFDRILLRPRGTALQVIGSNIDIVRVGRILLTVAIYAVALPQLDIDWSFAKVLTFVLMNISGIFVFFGIFILGATVCFWTVEGLEFLNILTYGGQQLTSYPLGIYPKPLIFVCSFIIPFGSFNYLPLMYITGRGEGSLLYMLSPLLGVVFIVPCLALWHWGVKHYLSTGN
jgi:ABC-2 type transport system permease protein